MYEDLIDLYPWETIPSGELEEDRRDKLNDFRRGLEIANEAGFYILGKSLLEYSPHSEKPVNIEVQSAVENELNYGGNNFYLSPEYAWLQDREPDTFSVLRTAKAETSAHGVFFGILQNTETEKGLPVAVKPCTQKPAKAYIDWIGNSLISRSGAMHFSPVGFLMDGGKAYSITELATNVETLDNSDWRQVLFNPEDQAYSGQRALLQDVGRNLAQLHNNNIIHADPQFKNIAVYITGKSFFIDWESASFFADEVPKSKLIKPMAHDLKILARSVACSEAEKGVGLLSSFSYSLKWEYFKRYIFDAYFDEALKMNDSDESIERLGEIEEIVESYILEPDGLAATIKSIRKGSREG